METFTVVDEPRPARRRQRRAAAPQPDGPVPEYSVVTKITDGNRPPRRIRKDWRPVLDELLSGSMLFMSLEDLTDQNVKYLNLALTRRGGYEHLRTQREVRDGVLGRLIWIEATDD